MYNINYIYQGVQNLVGAINSNNRPKPKPRPPPPLPPEYPEEYEEPKAVVQQLAQSPHVK